MRAILTVLSANGVSTSPTITAKARKRAHLGAPAPVANVGGPAPGTFGSILPPAALRVIPVTSTKTSLTAPICQRGLWALIRTRHCTIGIRKERLDQTHILVP